MTRRPGTAKLWGTFMEIPSWVQLHGAITHFPIALLVLAMPIELGAFLLRNAPEKQRSWRQVSLLLLGVAFVTSLPALLTGYLTGQTFARLPAEFQTHWMLAAVSTVATGLAFLWRVMARDQLRQGPRVSSLALIVIGAAAVAWTGHLGGKMVFGDEEPSPVAAVPTPTPGADLHGERLELAAGRMEVAASKLDLATERMALQAERNRGSSPAPAPPVSIPPAQVIVPPAPAGSGASERAADKLERVADQYVRIADRLERVAQQLGKESGRPAVRVAPAPVAPRATTPLKTGTAKAPVPAAVATSAPLAAAPDPKLAALGEKYFFDDEIGGCDSCHKLNGKGGRGGPDLTGEGARRPSIDWQKAHLMDPPSVVAGSRMPSYKDLTQDQLLALAHFLVSQK